MSDINNVIESLSDTELQTLLAKIGLAYEKVDSNIYIVSLDGGELKFNVVLVNMHNNLLLTAKFNDGIDQSDLIKWNTNYACAKAYVQLDDCVTLAASHYLEGGVTVRNIVKFFGGFYSDLQTFSTEIP